MGKAENSKRAHTFPKWAIVVIVVAVVAACAGGITAAFATAALAPPGVAAKYNTLSYIEESEVDDYIATYREQMNLADVGDEEWATFLAQNGLTPERLRISTIRELLIGKIVDEKCDELGIEATDEEVQSSIDALRDSVAFGDDDLFQETLESYGRTEDNLREMYRQECLKQKLYTDQVPLPEPSDDEVLVVISNYVSQQETNDEEPVVRHSYCFKKKKSSFEGSLEELESVQAVRDEFAESERTLDDFVGILQQYCDDEETLESTGDAGWDVDADAFSTDYKSALRQLSANEVSNVLSDDEFYYFIWVDKTVDVSSVGELDTLPESLRNYFTDRVAYAQWQTKCDDYLEELIGEANLVIFDIPEDASYNVDLSLVAGNGGDGDVS